MTQSGANNEITYLLQSANSGESGLLASCAGWILPNRNPYLVGRRVLLRHSRGVRIMIKIDTVGQEYCLPCADDIEGVIVERGGVCIVCKQEREGE